MVTEMNFKEIVETILKRYRQTSLISRWEEATSSDPDPKPIAFWIRESSDLVNIVWLTRYDIRDITLFREDGESTFNLLRYSAISGFQVREYKDVAKSYGLKVSGDNLVQVHSYVKEGNLFWVASNVRETAELRKFLGQYVNVLSES